MPTPEHRRQAELLALLHTYLDGTNASKVPMPPFMVQLIRECLVAGYKLWPKSYDRNREDKSNPFFLQKRYDNARGDKLYFIDIAFWDLGREFPQYNGKVSLSPKCQFYVGARRDEGSRTVDVNAFLSDNDTLTNIEKFYADFYEKMGCVPYELYEDR